MSTSKKSYYYWFILMVLVSGCQSNHATLATADTSQSVCVLEEAKTNYMLRPFVEILLDTTTGYTIEEITQPILQSKFQVYPEHTLDIQNCQYYWGKVQIENALPLAAQQTEWVLTFSSTWSSLDVFTETESGSWKRESNGTFTPEHEKEFAPTARGNLVKLLLPPNEKVTVYFRGTSERKAIKPSFYLYLQPLEIFYNKLLDAKVENAVFIGFLLMMLFYNLIVYAFGRDRSFLYYSGYLLMVAVYAGYASDDLQDWIGFSLFSDHPAYLSFLKLAIYVGMMCYLAFIRSFLDLKQLLPRWDIFFKAVIYLGFPLMVLYVGVAYWSNFSYVLEDRVTVFYIASVIISCSIFLYPLYRTKDAKGYFIVAGITAISLGFLFTLISRVWWPPFTLFYLKAWTIIEILIFSLGLAYRQRQQEQAKQQADFALRESELIQEKNQLEADRLQELNDFKERFYTNITHEFRTPLTVIMGMTENIKGHLQEKTLIQRNSQNLLRLINRLLDLSKSASGGLRLNTVHQNVVVYLQYLTESFYSAAQQKNVRLVFYSEQEEIMMHYDEEKIQQIVYNLLSNALKFTSDRGRIVFHAAIMLQDGQSFLSLKVKDTGIGIAPENISAIFDRFYQVNDTASAPEGTGIGLSLTKELVELMAGSIEVESELGKGTTFSIQLPITEQPALETGTLLLEDAKLTQAEASALLAEEELEEAAFTESDLPVLLIVEDNQDIVTYIQSILQNSYRIHTARNGMLGIEKALEIIPDIIISDVMMPEKDGYEVCEALKKEERTSHIPIILLTAKSTQQDKVAGLAYGADAYLVKPFDKKELTVRLEKLVEVRQQLQARYSSSASAAEAATSSIEAAFLQRLHEQIQLRLNDTEFGVPQLAKATNLSQMQLYRKLKALTGKTPSQFIRSYRLQKGLELLKVGQLTVSEVAYEVGFADPSYFSRTFQKEFRRNPSDFINS